jgi:hypothetical protein
MTMSLGQPFSRAPPNATVNGDLTSLEYDLCISFAPWT